MLVSGRVVFAWLQPDSCWLLERPCTGSHGGRPSSGPVEMPTWPRTTRYCMAYRSIYPSIHLSIHLKACIIYFHIFHIPCLPSWGCILREKLRHVLANPPCFGFARVVFLDVWGSQNDWKLKVRQPGHDLDHVDQCAHQVGLIFQVVRRKNDC